MKHGGMLLTFTCSSWGCVKVTQNVRFSGRYWKEFHVGME